MERMYTEDKEYIHAMDQIRYGGERLFISFALLFPTQHHSITAS